MKILAMILFILIAVNVAAETAKPARLEPVFDRERVELSLETVAWEWEGAFSTTSCDGAPVWEYGSDANIPQQDCFGDPIGNVLGTLLNDSYVDHAGQRAILGPPFEITAESWLLELCHFYDSESWYDGGNLELQIDGRNTFIVPVGSYPVSSLGDGMFAPRCVESQPAFSGHPGSFQLDYFDLRAFIGETASVVLKFGSDTEFINNYGWYISSVRAGAATIDGQRIHIATTGSDTEGDGSAEFPFATLQHGIDTAAWGDTVIVKAGHYIEYDIDMKNGVLVTSESGAAGEVIIDGDGQSRVFYFDETDNTARLKGLVVTGGYGYYGGGMRADEAHPEISDCVIHGNATTDDGGGAKISRGAPVFRRCTFAANEAGWSGGAVGVHSGYPTLLNCIIWDCSAPPIELGDDGYIVVRCSDVEGDWSGAGNIDQDPRFCDPANADYSLHEESPCAEANSPDCGRMGAMPVGCIVAPSIIAVLDVPNDQGRQVRVTWSPCEHDAPGSDFPILDYSLWRRIDSAAGAAASTFAGREYPPGNWDYLATVPAGGETEYNAVLPTLCDSTDAGQCLSTFFVRAMTADPLVYFNSEPASGYSIDNIAPSAPDNLHMAAANLLSWDQVPDGDFDYYTVYVSATEEFEDCEVLGHSVETSFDVTGTDGQWLAVSTRDFNGNESELSIYLFNGTGVAQSPLPARSALHQNCPNPFNPATEIGFDLAISGPVTLEIYDIAGRRVSVLVDRVMDAGSYVAHWRAEDDKGRSLGSGVYLARLQAPDCRRTLKMLLVQ